MKRLLSVMCVMALCLVSFSGIPVAAADTVHDDAADEPTNVTITVVMPGHEPETEQVVEPVQSAPIKVYPSDVTEIREGSSWEIIKTYELDEHESPDDIPRDSFERNGWTFTLTDILRKETAHAEARPHTETITLNTDTKELEKILPLLDQTMEYTAEDGFTGILNLDVSSITVETAGTKTTSYAMSVTREYPHLSANDTSLVPKTVEDRGTTYTLAGVDWRAGNTVTVDYEALPEYYTAVATYTATGYSTKATGYTTTAVYNGDLAKLTQGKTVYTAYFLGEEIRTPLEMIEPVPVAEPEPDASEIPDLTEQPQDAAEEKTTSIAWLAIIPCAVILVCGTGYFMKKGRTKPNEKTHNHASNAFDGGDNGDTGSGC